MKLTYIGQRADLGPTEDLSAHRLLFAHIPKCAGTTLEHVLQAALSEHGRRAARIFGTLYGQFLGPGKDDSADKLPGGAYRLPDEIGLLSAHLPPQKLGRFAPPHLLITILRDPIERFRSHYAFGQTRGGWPAGTKLSALVDAGLLIDNPQTRQLAGLEDRGIAIAGRHLRFAKECLRDRIALVGFAEAFDDFLAKLIRLCGLPDICYGRRQTGAQMPPALPARFEEEVLGLTELDRQLYDWAREDPEIAMPPLLSSQGMPRWVRGDRVAVTGQGLRFPNGQDHTVMPAGEFDAFLQAAQNRGAKVGGPALDLLGLQPQ